MIRRLFSFFAKIVIQFQRVTDHAWRRATGLPTLKRSHLTPNLYLGGQYRISRLRSLTKLGITAIVNMRIKSIYEEARFSGFKHLHLPTVDKTAPTMKNLKKGVKFIDEEVKNSGKVYIHCREGEGRGPTMAIAYLIFSGLTFQDAYDLVKKVRTFIRPTAVQIEQLQKFEKEIRKEKK